MDKPDHITVVGRLFQVAVTILVCGFVAVILGVLLLLIVLHQGVTNQRHIDCIVAAFATTPPEYCVPVIQHLIDEGVIDRPPLTSVPVTSDP